jgi:purine-nucleoside phosphorylase
LNQRSSDYQHKVESAAAFLSDRISSFPSTAIIMGTGLSHLGEAIDTRAAIPYGNIPHFPRSTVESHAGNLIVGTLAGVEIAALQGRFHLYEGYSAREITLPIRALALCGINRIIISNAAGGMNPDYRRGDIMVIEDHINMQGANPLEGENVDTWGPRFPDMSRPYDIELLNHASEAALKLGLDLQKGVYLAVAGPNLETRAEYRMIRTLGADAVGMSTVAEVLVARHMGLKVLAFSVITDECFPDTLEPVSLEDVLAAASKAEPRLRSLITEVLPVL